MRFIDPRHDSWKPLGGDEALAAHAGVVLTWAQWRALRADGPLPASLALRLANDHDVESIGGEIDRFSLVELDFPKWTDGRAYSQARLLRTRLRFGGELRATGEVLVDMLPLLQRTGFDAVVLRADQSLESAQRALRFFAGHYQGDAVEPRPLFRRPQTPGVELVGH